MSGSTSPFHVYSLIQGISQQAPQAVKQSSAKDQQNCINDILLGVRARNGSTFKDYWAGNRVGAFHHRIMRSADEDYVVMITDGVLEVFNLADATKCTVTGNISAYLACTGTPKDVFRAATIEDTTLISNSEFTPAMGTAKSAARSNWALAHFKSANYSVEYKLTIKISGGSTVTVTYKTPDNSASANADYIATNRLAKEFKDNLAANGTLSAAGFTFTQYGSTIHIKGGAADFSVATQDGLGGEQFIAFKERVKDISDLPVSTPNGYDVAVGSDKKEKAYDYYLEYSGEEQGGQWIERVAPDTKTGLNASTMPHLLVNTAKNTFEVKAATWGSRLSGDGIDTAKDPAFVGKPIVDMNFLDSRLAIITESSYSFSRTANAFSFFPDSAQLTLDTDPIHATIANGKSTIVSGSALVGETLTLWANNIQSAITSGDSVLAEDTVENKPRTYYEYDGVVPPLPFGLSSLVFGTSRGEWNDLMEVLYRGDRPSGEIHLNGHCLNLIGGELVDIGIGTTSRFLHVITDEAAAKVYVYQWFNSGEERVQSAWNYFTWDAASRVIWAGISGSKLHVFLDWAGAGFSLETVELEYAGDELGEIPLRADHRVSEDFVTATGTGYYDVTLPFTVPTAMRDRFVAYHRVDDDNTGEQRGVLLDTEWQSATVVRVFSDIADLRFFVGCPPVAFRDLPELFIEDRTGASILVESLNITNLFVRHTNSTYYKIVVTREGAVQDDVEEFSARRNSNPSVVNNRMAHEKSGFQKARIAEDSDAVSIRLLNDTIYPSSWESMKYHYVANSRAK